MRSQSRVNMLLGGIAVVLSSLTGCAVWSGAAFEDQERDVRNHVFTSEPLAEGDTAEQQYQSVLNHAAVVDYEHIEIPPLQNIKPSDAYILGANDVLFVAVTGHPDFSTPAPRAGGLNAIGSRIDGHGFVQLPLIGSVRIGGLTTLQAQRHIENALKRYIQEPTVVVEVIQFGSQPLYLVGQFNTPGVVYMDRPTTLVQALAKGGGFDVKESHLRGASVQRGDRVISVDIFKLLREGDMRQNIWMRPYDTIYIPDTIDQVVFVVGDVHTQGPVDMRHGRLTLMQAIATANGYERLGSQLSRVRIIRPLSATSGEIMIVDIHKILRGEAIDFQLRAGDLVYVPRSDLGNWNDMVREILPTVMLISSILDPFIVLRIFG